MNNKERLTQFLSNNPNDSFSLYALALEERKDDNLDKSLSLLKKVIQLEPEHIGAYYQAAEVSIDLNNHEAANGFINQGIEVSKLKNDKKSVDEFTALQLSIS